MNDESRPKPAPEVIAATTTSIPPTGIAKAEDNTESPTLTLADADGLLDHVRGALVVLTAIDEDRYRRRVYLSAAAAERHLKRARAAGHRAEVLLAELRPVFLLGGDQ